MHLHPTSFRWTSTALAVLLTVSLVRSQFPYEGFRRLKISPKECVSSKHPGITGICMFNLECQEKAGTVIGACVDRFLFGACCHIPDNQSVLNSEEPIVTTTVPTTTSTTTRATTSTTSTTTRTSTSIATTTPLTTSTTARQTTTEPATLQYVPLTRRPDVLLKNGANPEVRESPGNDQPSITQRNGLAASGGGSLHDQFADTTLRPVRFPIRPSAGSVVSSGQPSPVNGVTTENASSQTVVSLHPAHDSLPAGELSTLPSTRDTSTVLPIALETFSSFSDPISYSASGNNHNLHHSHGQSIVSLESAPLNLNKNVYYTGGQSEEVFTEDPPKLSTFMYVDLLSGTKNDNLNYFNYSHVDADSNSNNNNKDSIREATTTEEIAPERTTTVLPSSVFSESLINGGSGISNTEKVWSLMLQLASQVQDATKTTTESEVKLNSDELFASLSSSGNKSPGPSLVSQSNKEVPIVDDITLSDIWKITTSSSVSGDSTTSTTEDQNTNSFVKEDTENPSTISTLRPWAASTYQVHTFKYPDEKLTTLKTTEKTSGTTNKPSPGQLSTWYGIATAPVRTTTSTTVKPVPITTTFFPLITAKRTTPTTTTTSTTTTTPQTTTTESTRPTTTPKLEERIVTRPTPSTTERAYTLPAKKKPTPGAIEDLAPPPTKRPTVSPFSGIITANKKPNRVGVKPSLNEKDSDSSSSSSVFQDDLEANLDDFVNQVVQGLAGSLDSLDFDDVILSASARPPSAPSTLHPFSVLSDPLFPPFPVVGKVPLTKPSKTGIGKPGLNKPAGNGFRAPPPPKKVTTTTTTQRPLDFRKDCGIRPMIKSGRIVGGSPAKFGKWPWQALVREATWLGLFSKNKCGGVLIAPKYVLTAAHCQPGFLATLTVVLGDFDITTETEAGNTNAITKNVKRVIVHRDYNAQTFENDIAILELESAIEYQQHIVPICMPSEKDIYVGQKAFVTGWGRLKYGGGVPQQLHEVDVPIINNTECQQMFLKSGHIKAIRDSFICAGYAQGLKDSCEGDSGGPLALQRANGQWVLAGTVSHGIKCAYPNLPGVYMRMTFYKPWIKRITGVS